VASESGANVTFSDQGIELACARLDNGELACDEKAVDQD
jgi:hypothetical protein